MKGAGAALLGATLFSACGERAAPLSAVLITLDTTNRDALGCYGQALFLTPHLDRLAAEGILFEEARTVAPLTLPAHASMLTGLVPLRHGLRDNGQAPLPDAAETVAERLSAAGFQTAAFVSAVVLAAPYGLAQGFDAYDAPRGRSEGAVGGVLERPAVETFRAARAWLRARARGRPFFLWVHAFEPHEPHAPARELLELAGGDAYLGEVAALDRAVGELLEALAEDPGLDRLVVLVCADHGEALGDHGERTHSVLCYERVLRVPLLVRLPDGERAGTRVPTPVSVTDVAPTLLASLGVEAPAGIDGRDLLGTHAERGLYFESYTGYLNYGWSPLVGWLAGTSKYLHSSSPELYDLASDPRERTNLVGERPEAVARARAALEALAALERLPQATALDERLSADIRALGYAGSAGGEARIPEPLEDTALPAPRTRMNELRRFYRALLASHAGRTSEAIDELGAIVGENPGNATALSMLATLLIQEKEAVRALEVLRSMPAAALARSTVQDQLGHALEQLGRFSEALPHFERALQALPGDEHQEQDVARVRARLAPR